MKSKFVLSFILFGALLVGAVVTGYAQTVSVSGSIGAFANPNQSSGNRFDNIGLHADLAAHVNHLNIGGSVDGADNNASRAFYFASYNVPAFKEFVFDLGGGFHTFGSLTRGFGHAGVSYEKFAGFVRAGSHDTVQLEARYKVADFAAGKVSLWPVYNYYHMRFNGSSQTIDIHSIGVRVGFDSSK